MRGVTFDCLSSLFLPALRSMGALLVMFIGVSCQNGAPYAAAPLPPAKLARHLSDRFSVMLSLPAEDANRALASGRVELRSGVKVATATPIDDQGFFLTAHHALGDSGNVCMVHYSTGAQARRGIAEVCWVDEKADLALLKAPFPTPAFYAWTPATQVLPRGTKVRHGGAATGPRSDWGELMQPVNGSRWNRDVRHSLRLEPGDSGGPLITLNGELVGINQAVGYVGVMDTRFFSASRSVRPSLSVLQKQVRAHLATKAPPSTP